MLIHGVLYLGRPDLVTGGIDHALKPVAHEKVAVFVHISEVARAQKNGGNFRKRKKFDGASSSTLGDVPNSNGRVAID